MGIEKYVWHCSWQTRKSYNTETISNTIRFYVVPFFYQTLPNLLNSFPKLFDQFQPSWNYVWWRVFGQLDKWEFNWHAKQEISGHIFPQTPRNQTCFLLIGGFLKPVSLHFLKALEHWLQQIATVLPILSDSQQPDAEGQLSWWTNLFLHIPYQNLFKAALPASACSLHCAATGIRKLWDMANCSELWAGRVTCLCPGLAPGRQSLSPAATKAGAQGHHGTFCKPWGASHTYRQGTQGTAPQLRLRHPFPFPWNTFPAWPWRLKTHTHRDPKKAFHPHFAAPLQPALFMAIIHVWHVEAIT